MVATLRSGDWSRPDGEFSRVSKGFVEEVIPRLGHRTVIFQLLLFIFVMANPD